jgi:hypothetical protein
MPCLGKVFRKNFIAQLCEVWQQKSDNRSPATEVRQQKSDNNRLVEWIDEWTLKILHSLGKSNEQKSDN